MNFNIVSRLLGFRLGLGLEAENGGTLVVGRSDGTQTLIGAHATAVLTAAQVNALAATPRTIIGAQGAGLAIVPRMMAIHKPAGTAFAAVGGDLVLKYTNGAGAQCSGAIETTGFLDQATAQTRVVGMFTAGTGVTPADFTPAANAPLVLHNLGSEFTTGTSSLYVRVWFDVIPTAFTGN